MKLTLRGLKDVGLHIWALGMSGSKEHGGNLCVKFGRRGNVVIELSAKSDFAYRYRCNPPPPPTQAVKLIHQQPMNEYQEL